MYQTEFSIAKMDCASEEQLVRMRLQNFAAVNSLHFDLQNRRLLVYHDGDAQQILSALEELGLHTRLISSELIDGKVQDRPQDERALLWKVLLINFFFFLAEMVTGFIGNSMGLVADSLDMLADTFIYGLALYAVGGTAARKKTIAGLSGYFQLALAVFGLLEVLRRFLTSGGVPDFRLMILVSLFALVGNAISLYLLQKQRSSEVHMQASAIFTSNDVVVNLGVIGAGCLVFLTSSKLPDLIVGIIVFLIVARGAFRILRLSRL